MVNVIQHSNRLNFHVHLVLAVFAEQIFFQTLNTSQDVANAIATFIGTPHFSAIGDAIALLFMEQDKFQAWLSGSALHGAENLLHDKLLQVALANRSGK